MLRKLVLMLLTFTSILFSQVSLLPFPVQQSDTIFIDDFENGLNDWTPYNLANPPFPSLWRLTNIKYVSPGTSLGWYDTLTNSYPHLSSQAIVSPSFLIPSNAKVYLSFDVFIHLSPHGSNGNDNFDIQVTTDNGSTWNYFTQYAYSGQQIGWKNFPADYSPETGEITMYAGKTIQFRFLITTDNLDPNGEGVFIDNFRIIKTDCEFTDIFEPNNTLDQATPVAHSQNINAALCPVGDFDFYSFHVSQNDRINVTVEHNVFQVTLTLYTPSGTIAASTGNKHLTYNAAVSGIYKLKVSLSDIFTYTVNYNLYVNVINTKPDIMSVIDIPGDQGLEVKVQWQYSLFDPPDSVSTIEQYHLFRKVNDTLSFPGKIISKEEINSLLTLKGTTLLLLDEYWDYVTSIPAVSPRPFSNYTFTAPTLKDSAETSFIIAAVSKTPNNPVLWGAAGTGVSYDNIAPQFQDYSISTTPVGITLNWDIDENIYPDVAEFRIYKGMFERFSPANSIMNISFNPYVNTFTDKEVDPGETYFYILSVVDIAGNITNTSAVSGTVTSVVEENLIPGEIFLNQNYPNPFNPVTIIEFSLPSQKAVTLKVYDPLGREISELVKGNYTSGTYRVPFDGSRLPSGIYFYTLTAGEFSVTKKLTLLK